MNAGWRRAGIIAVPALTLGSVALMSWLVTIREQIPLGPMRVLPYIAPVPDESKLSLVGPPPTLLERLTPVQAELRNALLPYAGLPVELGANYQPGAEAQAAALECMTSAVYYEAANEPIAGKRAVAQVIINRTASTAFPHSICGVVEQGAPRPGCQFTFMCDGSLSRRPVAGLWAAAQSVARDALSGYVDAEVGRATHYHADYVVPIWAPTMIKLTKIGRHIFYRWPGARGLAPASKPLESLVHAGDDGGVSPSAVAVSSPASSLSASSAGALDNPTVAAAPPAEETGTASSGPALPKASEPSFTHPSVIFQPSPARAPPPRRAMPDATLRNGPL